MALDLYVPDYIDELVDAASDPQVILLAREGSNEEAYQHAMFQRAGTTQVITRCLIEQKDREDDEYEKLVLEREERARTHRKHTTN